VNFHLGNQHNWEKTKFHLEAAAMARNEVARNSLGEIEFDQFSNYDQAIKIGLLLHLLGSIMPCITCYLVWEKVWLAEMLLTQL